ncbi:class I SAM-dependent methyltransferase [Chromatocurvus halotolerans]|uniref:class I SAM-dependent methyltransferase n=1 Tax=Chromatocurvus halotolerans TaxID=1132028 RepID=UPI000E3DBBE0|nr:class I SAM-dependent methyltransferase [Chromatocurvus halotolerans]
MQTVDRCHFPLLPGQRVLDLGCGEGRHAVAAHLHDGADVLGIDLSLPDLLTARSRHGEFRRNSDDAMFALANASALALPLADDSLDAVICSEVLEHIEDYRAVLQEIRRVLRPGGLLCISVPRAWPERICWWLSRAYHDVPGGHLRIFSRRRLQAEITGMGFACYYRHGAHALHAPYWWLQCLFWRTRGTNALIRQYHRLLVWDMLDKPRVTRTLERLLNPWMGKSVVMYFHKRVAT